MQQTWTCWPCRHGPPPRSTQRGARRAELGGGIHARRFVGHVPQRPTASAQSRSLWEALTRALSLPTHLSFPPQGGPLCAGGFWGRAALCSGGHVPSHGRRQRRGDGCRGGGAGRRGRQAAAVLHRWPAPAGTCVCVPRWCWLACSNCRGQFGTHSVQQGWRAAASLPLHLARCEAAFSAARAQVTLLRERWVWLPPSDAALLRRTLLHMLARVRHAGRAMLLLVHHAALKGCHVVMLC